MYRNHSGLMGNKRQRNSLAFHIASCVFCGCFAGAVHDGSLELSKGRAVIASTGDLHVRSSNSIRMIRTERETQSILDVSQRHRRFSAPVYAQPGPGQATTPISTSFFTYGPNPVPLNSAAISIVASTTPSGAMAIAGSSTFPGAVPIAASTTFSVAIPNAANTSLEPLVPGVSGVPSTHNCSNVTTSATGCASRARTWKGWFIVALAPVLCVFVAMGIVAMQSSTKKDKLGKKPFSWTARALGLIVAWNLLLMSLPKVGYIFAGCFWSSVTGLTTVLTFGACCVSPVCDFLDIPSVFGSLSNRVTASTLLTGGGSGLSFALFVGDPVCARTFVWLFIFCCIDGAIFGWAFWKGEDNMVMAALNRVAG
eukprot:CAMPEP_0172663242 /NCGR_PEP_ID=MMETSP1074-20121228/5801_1 /TAXON_ID=2916 /ORGANISM="Ceratium fusus, Strain PA161109" /LENGTH=367 /DNA_ID=CAMNT_0013479207 /DNA_START=74 /DNA_END=1177 /DNA_ORIENTATION=+